MIWVEECEFVTQLKLEECYAKLALAFNNRAIKQSVRITEVLWDGNNVYFAAEMTHNYGRISAWAGLEGKVSKNERDGQIYVHYYIGDSLYVVGFLIVLCALLFFSTFYYHLNIIIGIVFSGLYCLLLIRSFRRLMKGISGDFKSKITQYLTDKSNFKIYSLNFRL